MPGRRSRFVPWFMVIAAAWSAIVLSADYAASRGWLGLWTTIGRFLGPAIGLGLVIVVVWRARRIESGAGLRAILGGLAGAGLLAMVLTAVQIGPAWEYARRTTRMAGASSPSLYDYSVEPYRLAEAIWPHVFGLEVPENDTWIQALPSPGERMIWSPSLYIGAFVLVLAIGGAGRAGEPPWRCWLTILAMVSLVAGMGKFAGPLWWARWIPGAADLLGPHDPPASLARPDAFLPDGAGSVYGALAMVLPGFAMFRYPAKLMVVTCLCAASLAGLGWDRLCRERSAPGPTVRRCLAGLVASAGLVLLIVVGRATIERWVSSAGPGRLAVRAGRCRPGGGRNPVGPGPGGGGLRRGGDAVGDGRGSAPPGRGGGPARRDRRPGDGRMPDRVDRPPGRSRRHPRGRPADRPGGAAPTPRRVRSASIGSSSGIPARSPDDGRPGASPSWLPGSTTRSTGCMPSPSACRTR